MGLLDNATKLTAMPAIRQHSGTPSLPSLTEDEKSVIRSLEPGEALQVKDFMGIKASNNNDREYRAAVKARNELNTQLKTAGFDMYDARDNVSGEWQVALRPTAGEEDDTTKRSVYILHRVNEIAAEAATV